jgi:predicted transcriptional regulator
MLRFSFSRRVRLRVSIDASRISRLFLRMNTRRNARTKYVQGLHANGMEQQNDNQPTFAITVKT